MKLQQSETFSVANFEGPINLLWLLIQRDEIDIYQIPIYEITQQYLAKTYRNDHDMVDEGAEFIACAASLIWLKSRALLPKHVQEELPPDEESDPGFEVIHQLIDYCRFREAARELADREQKQGAFFARGVEANPSEKNLGIAHLSLDDLAKMFCRVLANASTARGVIHEELWKVSDKISTIRLLLSQMDAIPFGQLFTSEKSREELIVTFLALLELMKTGEVRVDLFFQITRGSVNHG